MLDRQQRKSCGHNETVGEAGNGQIDREETDRRSEGSFSDFEKFRFF